MGMLLAAMISTEHVLLVVNVSNYFSDSSITVYGSQQHSILPYSKIPKYWMLYSTRSATHTIKELKSKPPSQVSGAYYFQKMYYLIICVRAHVYIHVCLCTCVYRGQKWESEPRTSVTGGFNLLNIQGAKLRASGRTLSPLSHWATSPSLMWCIPHDGKPM